LRGPPHEREDAGLLVFEPAALFVEVVLGGQMLLLSGGKALVSLGLGLGQTLDLSLLLLELSPDFLSPAGQFLETLFVALDLVAQVREGGLGELLTLLGLFLARLLAEALVLDLLLLAGDALTLDLRVGQLLLMLAEPALRHGQIRLSLLALAGDLPE